MRFSVKNSYRDLEYREKKGMPDAVPLNIISGGCHLYGYLLTPGDIYEDPHPAVIMFHGFPGYTTNNDLEYALMRMGCVVIHVNHRGAWGSGGCYLFSNLVEDAVAIAKWAHNPAVATQYKIDESSIFLVGHSMGGMTVLNAAGKLPFIRGVAAITPYDLHAAFQYGLEKELFLLIEGEGQCLHMTSASDVYENAMKYSGSLSVANTYRYLKDREVLFVAATEDVVAPAKYMILPVYEHLKKNPGKGQCELVTLDTNHGLCGQRIVLAEKLGQWMEKQLG